MPTEPKLGLTNFCHPPTQRQTLQKEIVHFLRIHIYAAWDLELPTKPYFIGVSVYVCVSMRLGGACTYEQWYAEVINQ